MLLFQNLLPLLFEKDGASC